jgi:Undecaprenyl-phosphate glucose phosphotransferase
VHSTNLLYRLMRAFHLRMWAHPRISFAATVEGADRFACVSERRRTTRAESERKMLDDHPDRRQSPVGFQSGTRPPPLATFPRRANRDSRDVNQTRAIPITEWFLSQFSDGTRGLIGSTNRLLNDEAYAPAVLVLDAAVIVLISVVTGTAYNLAAFGRIGHIEMFAPSGLLVSLLYFGIVRLKAMRLPFGSSHAYERACLGLSSWVAAFALFLFFEFSLKAATHLSRGATLLFFVGGIFAVALSRAGIPVAVARVLKTTALGRRDVILIGQYSDPLLVALAAELRATIQSEPAVVMFDAACRDDLWSGELRRTLDRALKCAHGAGPGEIVVVCPWLATERLSALLEGLAEIPRSICVVPDDSTASYFRQNFTTIGERVAVEVQRSPLGVTQRAVKRAIDITCAATAIAFLAPLLAAVALAIRFDSPGPVLFRQTRTGYRGRTFKILKFRTMTVLEDGSALLQARRNDSRATKVGAWLRRTSLDELPQLFNVLKGDMSLVGPRPHAVAHDLLYERHIGNYALRQHVKPGISGWAQINGLRGETSTIDAMRSRVEHDLWYVQHCSLLLDIEIMARTVFEVLRQTNAY